MSTMIPEVISVEPTEGYPLRLTFNDGTAGEVDVAGSVRFGGVFEPLRDPGEFREIRVDADLGTITWPSGAELDPLVLYSKVRGIEVDDLLATKSRIGE